jgi:hypothetical protein
MAIKNFQYNVFKSTFFMALLQKEEEGVNELFFT